MKKRILSLILVLLMVCSLLPVGALAAVSTNYTLTGNQANDIVAVATAQKGKSRSDFGWTNEWCAYFTCWAGRTAKADFPKSNIGNACDLAIWFLDNNKGSFYYFRDGNYTSLKNNGLKNTSAPIKASRASFKPQKGDLICFLWEEDAGQYNWSHIGIVSETYSGSGNIKTIEGNTSGGVVASKSRAYDSTVVGFIRPNYKDTSNPNVAPKLTISGVKAPTALAVGESFPLRGVIKTNYGTITSVTAAVTDGSNKTALTYTAKPKTASYDINGPMDDAITFGKLAEGTYTYTVKATAVNGSKSTTSTLVNQNFVVGTPKYTVTYNANGGTGAPAKQTKAYGKDLTLSSTVPKKSFVLTIDMNNPDMDYEVEKHTFNCKFSGWNTKANGTGTNYASGAKYTSNANVTLYANWNNPNVTYSIRTDLCTCFLGLYTAPEGGKKMEPGFELTSNLTLYGHWNKTNSATHNWGEWTVISEATCEKDGLKTLTCKSCGYTIEQKIPAISHNWDSGRITKPATETATGIKTYTCTLCGATRTEIVPKLTHTHSYTAKVTAPNCTEKGYTTHTCTCGYSYVDSYVNALGHSWNNGVITKSATETATGVKTYTCTRCGATKTEIIPKLEHTHSGTCGDNLIWTLDAKGVLTISGTGKMYDYYDPDHGTRPPWDPYVDSIKKIVIVNGVTSIGETAFSGCKNLTSVTIPNSITYLPWYAFSECTSLTSVTIPDSITGISWGVFAGCESLRSITIPDSVTSIGLEAFFDCTSLTSVVIGKGVTSISESVFGECTSLTNVTISESVTIIGNKAFEYCDMLTDVYFGGTEAQWKAIQIEKGNDVLKSAVIHYRSEYPFTDVDTEGRHLPFADAIQWAANKGITTGYGDGIFKPNLDCSRAQVVTFLWRAAGEPEPKSTANPFVDVAAKQANGKDNPFYTAILWAVGEGITNGVDSTHFAPDATVTRAQFVTFLWRYENKPAAKPGVTLTDINTVTNADFKSAIQWAAGEGITTGYSDGSFRPNAGCTRAHVVTFIYRDMT